MPMLFSIHLSKSPIGFGKPAVKAVPAIVAGVWCERTNQVMVPDPEGVRACLPHYWQGCYDRSPSFWFDKESRLPILGGRFTGGTPRLTLRDKRGRALNTIYAIPYWFEPFGPRTRYPVSIQCTAPTGETGTFISTVEGELVSPVLDSFATLCKWASDNGYSFKGDDPDYPVGVYLK